MKTDATCQTNWLNPLGLLAAVLLLAGTAAQPLLASDGGRALYNTHCGNCHGQEGEGFLRVYPPLTASSFLGPDLAELPCIITNGLRGEITVNGKVFNQVMPGNDRLTPEQIGDIIDYMTRTWADGPVSLDVEAQLARCSENP